MTDKAPPRELAGDDVFASLVMMMTTSALQQLGKLVNPASGKAEVSLEGAQFAIDTLEMLERKTRGNLTQEEQRFLSQNLTTLRLNYVEVSRGQASAPAAAEAAAADAEDTAAAPAAAPDAATEQEDRPAAPADQAEHGEVKPPAGAQDDGEEPRFHKSYG